MIIKKSSKNYKCLFAFIMILLSTSLTSCSKIINDYKIKNITYGKNKNDIAVDLEFDKTKIFNIKDYDIDPILPNSNIKLIKNLRFHARALTPKIFQFLIVDKNSKRFMPPLIDEEFKLKDKKSNEDFYNFDGSNFLYSDTLIMFDQLLTTKYIYGFGERNFDFNL